MEMILFSVALFLGVIWWFYNPKQLPPGPYGWPLIGYLPAFVVHLFRGRLSPHEILDKLSQKYGSISSMYFGRTLVVVLNSREVVREAFDNPNMSNRLGIELYKEMKLAQGIFDSSGEPWKHQRRFIIKTLRSFGLGKNRMEDNISNEAKYLTQAIALQGGESFDPKTMIHNAISNITCQVIFGQRFEYNDPGFRSLLDSFTELSQLAGPGGFVIFFPLAKYFQPSIHKRMTDNVNNVKAFVEHAVENHQRDLEVENPRDYIDVYLQEIQLASTTSLKSFINHQSLTTTIMELFAAGTETLATTIRWAILYLMVYPEVQERIHRELDSVVGRNRRPSLADKPNLPLTRAFLLELQRVASVIPLGVFHCSAEDITLAGYRIPKASVVISNLWGIHHDSTVWDNPNEFNPDRFLDKDGVLHERKELIPFSLGRRVCIGEQLAKLELFIFITHICHQFTFKKPENSPPVSLEAVAGVLRSPRPFLVQASRRESRRE